MSDTNFTRSQGETWRITVEMEDAYCVPSMLADASKSPLLYFAGVATKSGQTTIPMHFKMHDVETKTHGRGNKRVTEHGVYKIYAYIPADEIGSCSITAHSDKATCELNSGTWTVNTAASLLTTSKMETGDWRYEIRVADAMDISGLETANTILEGKLTILDGPLDSTPGSAFTFSAPTA
jgi:hypothetical protein